MKHHALLLPDENKPLADIPAAATAEEILQILLQKVARMSPQGAPSSRNDVALPAPNRPSPNLCLSVADGMVFVPLDEIRYIKADGPYSEIHFAQSKMVLIAKTLKEMCSRIACPDFARVHQSYLVNLNWVEKLHRDGYLVLKTQEHIHVSRVNRQKVVDALMATKNA
jgi:two-component system LytT family response regulator